MKTIFTTLVLCLSIFSISAIAQNPASARGCVIFKRASQTTASMEEYRKFENLGTNISVTDLAGKLLTVLPGEKPIFIPYPTDPSATLEKATAQIGIARKTYPESSRRLAAIEKAWAAAPRATVAAIPTAPVSLQPSPDSEALPKNNPKGMEIVTISGTKYENVTIKLVEPDGLSISHDAGLTKIPFAELGEELRAKYGFDQKKAAQFTAANQETLKQKAAAQQKAAAEQQAQADQLKRTKKFDVQVVSVKGREAIVGPLTSTEEIPQTIFVEGLTGVAGGEKYEIAAFRDGTFADQDWGTVQRWICKSVSKDLKILNQRQESEQRLKYNRAVPSTSLQRVGGG